MASHKAFNKVKRNQNNTGFYRVSRHKSGRFFYSIHNEVLKVSITSKNLLKLKQKVINNNLHWFIIDKEKALKTAKANKINPMLLNSNVNEKYINYKFDWKDCQEYKKTKTFKIKWFNLIK